MAPSPLDKQTASCNSPHDWLMSLAMDLAALCDIRMEVKMVPMDAIWVPLEKTQPFPATQWLPAHPPPFHLIGVLVVLPMPVYNGGQFS